MCHLLDGGNVCSSCLVVPASATSPTGFSNNVREPAVWGLKSRGLRLPPLLAVSVSNSCFGWREFEPQSERGLRNPRVDAARRPEGTTEECWPCRGDAFITAASSANPTRCSGSGHAGTRAVPQLVGQLDLAPDLRELAPILGVEIDR